MRIIFTYYPEFIRYNHGVAVLSGLCKAAGIESYIIPLGGDFLFQVQELSPDYVGISFVTWHEQDLALPYLEVLHEWGIPLLAGGVYPRSGGQLDWKGFTGVARGESGADLIRFLLSGDRAVFGLSTEGGDIPAHLPAYDGVTGFEFRNRIPWMADKKILPYISSRGCPYKCSFCATQWQSKKIRVKTTIAEDLRKLTERYNPDAFYILDELPPVYRPEWRHQIEGNRVPLLMPIRADIKPDHLLFLIRNGLISCAFGVESGDEEYRNRVFKKDLKDEDIFRTVAILQDFGVGYTAFYIAGSPGETEKSLEKTKEMVHRLRGSTIFWQYEDLGR